MTYVALLRGINVGGKNLVKMAALRECFERAGMNRVATYIQTGNIVFESRERTPPALTRRIERMLSTTFGYEATVVVRSRADFARVLAGAPTSWKNGRDLRRNVAFLRSVTAKEALRQVPFKEGIDTISAGPGVLYLSTLVVAVSRSGLTKLIGLPVYRDMTIRNYTTCQKILGLMEERRSSS
jgi:uncharacterized protein (DUF1697 family)